METLLPFALEMVAINFYCIAMHCKLSLYAAVAVAKLLHAMLRHHMQHVQQGFASPGTPTRDSNPMDSTEMAL